MHVIIRDHHKKVARAVRGMILNEICNHGYWINGCKRNTQMCRMQKTT